MTLANLVCEKRIYSNCPYSHVHSYAQLLVPIQGSLTLEIHSHTVTSDENTILFVPADFTHSFFAKSRNEFFVFDIPLHFLRPQLADSLKNEICQPLDTRWQAIRTLLASEISSQHYNSQSIQDLFRYASRLLESPVQTGSLRYIEENYHKKFTVQELAALEHYTVSYYHEWFHKQTGTTPRLYIQKLRINKAKELLQHTDFPLQHISAQVGYEHQSTLSKAFQELEGISPLQFRIKNRN